ncbi:MAG TPA: SRPBCC family protein [Candidatus Acidoferrales bacterium]|nr:SRPBCC family protein [Candidatus Acidoferrales bacterium]
MPRPPEEYTRYVEFDMRPGGSNRMEIRTADGHLYLLRVTFREIVPPEKLVFTWAWERFSASGQKDEQQEETLVTVEFHERGRFTGVVLTHELFRDAELRDRHHTGWTGCFDMLAKVLAA